MTAIWSKLNQFGDCLAGHLKVIVVLLHPDTFVSHSFGSSESRPSPGKRVQNYALSERQDGPDDLPEERLRFQAWVGSQIALGLSRRRRGYDITERLLLAGSAESTSLPSSQIILDSSLYWLAVDNPRLPHGTRHDTDLRKFIVSGLGAVASSHCHRKPGDFATAF